MKKKILLALVTLVLLLSIVLSGCAASGVPQKDYDQLAAQLSTAQTQLSTAQSQLTKAQGDLTTLQSQKTAVDADLQTAQSKLTKAQSDLAALQSQKAAADVDLQAAQADVASFQSQVASLQLQANSLTKQVADLKTQYEFVGLTPTEMAGQMLENYANAHVYMVDIYDCNNMATDIWNMLKKQGINSVIVVGRVDFSVTDIFLTDHAWVLAEISPGEYLALETTGGMVMPQNTKNALYYQGWYFNDPAELNDYLTMVDMHNMLVAEDNTVIDEYNVATTQAERDRLEAIHDKFVELIGNEELALQAILTVDSLLN